jgi:hypothetical protein
MGSMLISSSLRADLIELDLLKRRRGDTAAFHPDGLSAVMGAVVLEMTEADAACRLRIGVESGLRFRGQSSCRC